VGGRVTGKHCGCNVLWLETWLSSFVPAGLWGCLEVDPREGDDEGGDRSMRVDLSGPHTKGGDDEGGDRGMHVGLSGPHTKGVPERVADPYPTELQQRQQKWAGHSDDNNRIEEVVGNMEQPSAWGLCTAEQMRGHCREHYGDKGLFWREAYDTVGRDSLTCCSQCTLVCSVHDVKTEMFCCIYLGVMEKRESEFDIHRKTECRSHKTKLMGVSAVEPPYAGQVGSIFGTSRVAGALATPFTKRGTVLMVADRCYKTHKFYVESRHHIGWGARG
jgi:hypothetical protein